MKTMTTYESTINAWGMISYHQVYYPFRDNEYFCLLSLRNSRTMAGKGQTKEEACKDIYEQVRGTLWRQLEKPESG